MSTTQFAMVEELASLIKDNFSSRHLVLAIEEALVNYLQDDPSPNGILQLEPMSSYNRLIIHRLADIFGFVHKSVGEGDDRHLVLQQCLDTAIPSILVSDILWQFDACESPPLPYQLLRRDDACTVLKISLASSPNFVEREAAYLAARERIFGTKNEDELKQPAKQRPRNVPVVARRMIAHALGQKIIHSNQAHGFEARHSSEEATMDDIERSINVSLDLQPKPFSNCVRIDKNLECFRGEDNDANESLVVHDEKLQKAVDRDLSNVAPKVSAKNRTTISKMSMKEENLGAAKRMFAHALGRQASKDGVPRVK